MLLTAFSQKELVERASEAGALAYVVKPFTPNDLLPAIEIALARYAQIIALEAEVGDLVERFETRKLVDRAKGLLNEKMGLTEPEAFRWIQKASMDRRLTMKDVSQAIIEQLAPEEVAPRPLTRGCRDDWFVAASVVCCGDRGPSRARRAVSAAACSLGGCRTQKSPPSS